MPSADLPDCPSTGEPCAVKAASTVRGGADGKGLQSTSPAAYSTYSIRRWFLAVKVARGAAVRKLLHQTWALGSNLQRFDPDHKLQYGAVP